MDIFGLHLRSRLAHGPALGAFDVDDAILADLADSTEGFTGAEIEQAVVSACFDAFDGRRHLAADDLRHAILTTVPLSVTQSEDITALRAWASLRAVSASTVADRTGYTVVAPAAEPAADPVAALQRGGRPVEV